MNWPISMLEMIGLIGAFIGVLALFLGKRLDFLFCGFIGSLLVAINAIKSDVPEAILFTDFSILFLSWIGEFKGMEWTKSMIFQAYYTFDCYFYECEKV